jgi:hypothetical protein
VSSLPTREELAAVFGRTADTYDTVIPLFATLGRRVADLAELPTGAGPTWDFFGQLVGRFAPRATRPVPPTPLPRANLDEVLHEAGFADIAVTDEVAHFVFPEPETWWRWAWSTGFRAPLECFAPDVLEEFAAEAFAHLRSVAQDDGIHLDQQARFVTARRPD